MFFFSLKRDEQMVFDTFVELTSDDYDTKTNLSSNLLRFSRYNQKRIQLVIQLSLYISAATACHALSDSLGAKEIFNAKFVLW